jgi:hypothetical protein
MDPNTGRLYTEEQVKALDRAVADRLVRMTGSEESIRKIARHVKRGTAEERKKARRKAASASRRKNR